MSELRQIPIHRSLIRPALTSGVERTLFYSNMIVCVGIYYAIQTIPALVIAIVLWVSAHTVFLKLAKKDPVFSQIYIRHTQYRDYYPAKAGYLAPSAQVKYAKL
jgi:type IV secretion system protein VirB3